MDKLRQFRMSLWKSLRALARDRKGTATIEFAFVAPILAVGLINVTDLGYYMYTRMEVENASEMGAQVAWKTCNDVQTDLPATTNCTGLNAAITAAIQSTSLGNNVTLAAGSPTEGYYCVNASNALQSVGSLANPPSDCSAVGNANISPGDYLLVSVTYNYAPMFPGLSVMSATGITTITKTSWMRMG